MRRVTFRQTRGGGYTLLELMVAMVGASALMVGLSSALFIALEATDTSNTSASATMEGLATLTELLSDIEFAEFFSAQTSTVITFVVPNRGGDSNPETIRYAWSGTPGDPLTRQYDGGAAAVAVQNVHVFQHDLPSPPSNLLFNPSFEAGTTSWSSSACSIVIDPQGDYHSRPQCLAVSGLSLATSGPYQTITAPIVKDSPYDIRVWIKTTSGTADFVIVLQIDATVSGTQIFQSAPTSVDTEWTRLSATLTPTWSGTLTGASLKFSNSTNFADFKVDDAMMRIEQTPRQTVNIGLQVGSDSRSLIQSGVPLLNSPL